MTKSTPSLAAAVAMALMPAAAFAGDESTLDTVVVTATRTALQVEDSLLPVEVIDRAEIERTQARDLPELLRGRAGIDLANQGGPGKLTTLSMRGTGSGQVLVLVDGVRVGSATAGLVSFQDLPLPQIERIEIVRGPRSSLYGSEAIGGVIQIFTRRDRGELATRGRIAVGSHARREASAGVGGGVGASGWFGADVAHQRTDGIDACRGRAADPEIPNDFGAGCFVDEPDRDGYRNRSLGLRGGVDLGERVALDANLLRAESDNQFDGGPFSGNEAENVQQAMGLRARFTPSRAQAWTVQAGRALDASENYFADPDAGTRTFTSAFDTRRDTASVQGDLGLTARQVLSLGADWQRDEVTSTTAYAIDSRENIAAFVGWQVQAGAQRWQASLRHDDNQQFGGATTGGLGWGWRGPQGTRLNLHHGTGFKAPTFNDLYFPGFGNPGLQPERSRSLNLGLAGDAGALAWQFDVYETRVRDLIAYDMSIFLPGNIDRARIRGAELGLEWSLAEWELGAQLTRTDPRNRSEGFNQGNVLPRRARNSGRIDLDRDFGAVRAGLTVIGAGHRFDNAANTARLGGYATTDLRLEFDLGRNWTLQAKAGNLFDRDYETVAYYNQPGREYLIGVRYAPR
jgi:vitamin B12 transporter